MTESIGSADNPYNGTFDGQGYYVYRFDIKSSDGMQHFLIRSVHGEV